MTTDWKELSIRGTLVEEVRVTSELISHGISLLQNQHFYNNAIDVPLILLANGFERLLKCMVCFKIHSTTGKLPSKRHIKIEYGHKIRSLVDYTLSSCYSDEYMQKGSTRSDMTFLKNSYVFTGIIDVLNDFAQRNRYANLDLILEDVPETREPDDDWGRRIEIPIMKHNPELLDLSSRNNPEFRRIVSQIVVSVIHRFMYSVSYLLALGGIGEYASMCAGSLKQFRDLSPDQFDYIV